ncbi:hypothetical protein D3C84_1161750 [compost metagenome]
MFAVRIEGFASYYYEVFFRSNPVITFFDETQRNDEIRTQNPSVATYYGLRLHVN